MPITMFCFVTLGFLDVYFAFVVPALEAPALGGLFVSRTVLIKSSPRGDPFPPRSKAILRSVFVREQFQFHRPRGKASHVSQMRHATGQAPRPIGSPATVGRHCERRWAVELSQVETRPACKATAALRRRFVGRRCPHLCRC